MIVESVYKIRAQIWD